MSESVNKFSFLHKFLNFDSSIKKLFDKIFKTKKYDWYRIENNHIVKFPDQDKVRLDEINSWKVQNEMIFDFVEIELKGNSILIWKDFNNDLISLLIKYANEKQK